MTPTGDERKSDMPIVVNLDVMMAKRKMSLNELAQRVDLRYTEIGADLTIPISLEVTEP